MASNPSVAARAVAIRKSQSRLDLPSSIRRCKVVPADDPLPKEFNSRFQTKALAALQSRAISRFIPTLCDLLAARLMPTEEPTKRAQRRPDDSNPPGTRGDEDACPLWGCGMGLFGFGPHRAEHAFTASTFPIDTSYADSLTPRPRAYPGRLRVIRPGAAG